MTVLIEYQELNIKEKQFGVWFTRVFSSSPGGYRLVGLVPLHMSRQTASDGLQAARVTVASMFATGK